MVSRSGEQLQLIDKYENNQPLLSVMADPDREFYEYLSKFNVRRTYANVINDRTVPYWTAALDTTNYFDTPRKLNM
ncbi:hypothetical protein DFQ29_009603 [Apophysomyces sp. BC1021]|nr:hypothetical protein DFQ29_009603 [Apophysomyces sp. BC1021]